MISKSSIHIDPGHVGHYSHNSRESFSHSQVFSDRDNEYYNDTEAALEIFQSELHLRSNAYTKRTSQQMQSNTATHLAAIVNLHEHHTLDDLKLICDHLELTLDTVVTQLAIHKDEGKLIHKATGEILTSGIDFFMDPVDYGLYYDKEYTEKLDISEWEIEKNIHGHIEMLGIDSMGKAIKRNRLNWYYLKELQTFTAKTLDMERGQQGKSYTKEQMVHIKSHMKPRSEYKSKKDYGSSFNSIAKQLGYFIPKKKRLDTHEFKAKMKSQNEIDNEKRRGEELLEKKDKQLKNRQLSLKDRDNEIDDLKQIILDNERMAKEKTMSHALTVSKLQKEVEALSAQKKVLEESNRGLLYAKGWKKNGMPVKNDKLIKYLTEKQKELKSELLQLTEEKEERLNSDRSLEAVITQLRQDIFDRDTAIEVLYSKVSESQDSINVLEDQILDMKKPKSLISKKDHGENQNISSQGMRF